MMIAQNRLTLRDLENNTSAIRTDKQTLIGCLGLSEMTWKRSSSLDAKSRRNLLYAIASRSGLIGNFLFSQEPKLFMSGGPGCLRSLLSCTCLALFS